MNVLQLIMSLVSVYETGFVLRSLWVYETGFVLRSLMAWGKKLLLSLSVFAIMLLMHMKGFKKNTYTVAYSL